jgi:hypothetical protein
VSYYHLFNPWILREGHFSLVATRKRLSNRQTLLGAMTTSLSQRRSKVGPDFSANRLLPFS